MEVARLVEQRKAGNITQEEFFVNLNKLRRANNARRDSPRELSAGRRPSSEPEAPPDQEAEDRVMCGTTSDICGVLAPSIRTARGIEGAEDRMGTTTSPTVSSISGPAPPPTKEQNNGASSQPRPAGEPALSSRVASMAVVPGDSRVTTGGVTQTLQEERRDGAVEFNREPASQEAQLVVADKRAVSRLSLNSTSARGSPSTPITTPDNARSSTADALASNRTQQQQLVLLNEAEREEEYDWLVSPNGEAQLPRRTHKTHVSRGTHCSRKSCGSRDDVGGHEANGTVRPVLVSPTPARTSASLVGRRNWIPIGGASQNAWHDDKRRPQQQNSIRPSASCTTSPEECRIVFVARRPDNDVHGNARRDRSEPGSSQGISRLEEARRRILTCSNRRRCALQSDTARTVGAPRTAQSVGNPAWPGPCLMRDQSRIDDDMSVRSLPSATRIRGSRSRHRESPTSRRLGGRGMSGSASVGSLERGGQFDRFSSRRDRYGYPLHERGGLGTTSDSRERSGSSHRLFSPMIKGLPNFYQFRPRRTLDSLGRTIQHASAGNASQQESLYARGTRWLAKAGDNRARELAMRQEQEMGACTFQPNCRCRSPPSTPLNKSGTGPVASSRTDNGGGGGIDAGDEEVGQGEEARRGEGTEGFRRNKSSTRRKDRSASRDSIEIGHRLFMESKRLNERKFEGKERKRMAEEEAYARSCTFKPSLEESTTRRMAGVRARYREALPPPPAAPVEQPLDETSTFRPQIVGIQPGMVRAREYLRLEVSQRLHRLHPKHPDRRQTPALLDRVSTRREGQGHLDHAEQRHGTASAVGPELLRGGTGVTSPRSRGLRDAEGLQHAEPGMRRDCDRFGQRAEGYHLSLGHSGLRRQIWQDVTQTIGMTLADGRRPRSAPAGFRARVSGERGEWKRDGHKEASEGVRQEELEELEEEAAGVCGVRRGAGGDGWRSRSRDGRAPHGERPRHQNSISFSEFLARQAHSQALARQRLGHLTRMHSPSFTPQLSKGSLRIEAQRAGGAVFGGGGGFNDRLKMTARRRKSARKAAMKLAAEMEQKECTFSPRLTPRARLARSRSARELSIGDAVLRQAKQRMAKAREETRLLRDLNTDVGRAGFWPRLETADRPLTPKASSRLRLADELDTYIERVKEEAIDREQYRMQQQLQALAEEKRACTFRPSVRGCPPLVKRTAESMRRIREFRLKEEMLWSARRPPSPPARPTWR